MKIVLLENVKKIGKKDEVVEVSDGYARNVLIPKKQAVQATSENINNLKLKNKNEEKKEENLRRIAEEVANVLEEIAEENYEREIDMAKYKRKKADELILFCYERMKG